jgi:hypothetical protein
MIRVRETNGSQGDPDHEGSATENCSPPGAFTQPNTFAYEGALVTRAKPETTTANKRSWRAQHSTTCTRDRFCGFQCLDVPRHDGRTRVVAPTYRRLAAAASANGQA